MSLVFHCQLIFGLLPIFLAKLGSAFYRSALFIVSHGSVGQSIFSKQNPPKCHCSSSTLPRVLIFVKVFRLSHFQWSSLPGCFAVCVSISFRYSFPLDLDPQPSAFRGSSASYITKYSETTSGEFSCAPPFCFPIPVFIIILFIWLHQVLVVARRIFHCSGCVLALRLLSRCGMRA